jgi:hypothetical protein
MAKQRKRKVKPNGKEEEREHRIMMEIVVDAYDEGERAMGWYCYLEEALEFSFTARCTAKRAVSPLKVGDEVEVIGMPPAEECEHEMFVMIRWEKEGLAVPLAQLRTAEASPATQQAVEDWRYWVEQGYYF